MVLAALLVLAGCGDVSSTAAASASSLVAPTFSFAPDAGLAARFPTSVDGKPVTSLQTGFFADVIGQLGAPDETLAQMSQALNAVGIDLATLSFGSALASVDGTEVRLQALRTPNADAARLVENYPAIVGAFGDAFGSSPPPGPTTTQSIIGGKQATVVAYSDGNRTVLYVDGDTMFIVDNTTGSQDTKILAALP